MESRRDFLRQTGAGALMLLGGLENRVARGDAPPNMLIFMSDEHAARCSSVHGHPVVRTPGMERLAARGTVFECAYCPSPLCMPSRSAFMSGRRVHEIQTYTNCNLMEFSHPTYGGELRKHGVHTVIAGKTDVYRHSSELGFCETMLTWDRPKPGDNLFGRDPLMIRDDAAQRADGFGPTQGNPFEHDDAVVNAALDWIDRRPLSGGPPWVLTVNITKPHFPHFVTPELWDLYPGGEDLPRFGRDEASANHPYAQDLRAHFQTDRFTDAQIRGLRRGYLGCVTYVDRQLGRFLDTLERRGLDRDTVVVYTSDHGEMLGKFGLWWICSMHEDSVRVPLIVAGPGFGKGDRIKTPVDLLDLQATVFETARVALPPQRHGTPLQHIDPNDEERVVLSEYHGHGTRSSAFMVRQGDWKLVHCAAAPHQLFHLAEDPEERNNLASRMPGKRAELEERLRAVCDPERETRRAVDMERRLLQMLS